MVLQGTVTLGPMTRQPLSEDEVSDLHARLSNWGRWGSDDQLGTLNFVTAEVTAAAASPCGRGRPCPVPGLSRRNRLLTTWRRCVHHMTGTATEGYGADYFAIASHGYATSHIDALCHIFHEGRIFNGYSAETVTAHGAGKLGIHNLRSGSHPGSLDRHTRRAGCRGAGAGRTHLSWDLEAAEAATGVEVQRGDALLVRTGRWRWRERHGPWTPSHGMAGLDASCLEWLHERDVAVLGSDGVSDVMPSPVENVPMPIHTVAIVAMGVHLLDNLDLDTLARACGDAGRWEFLLVVAPLVLDQGTASPVNPIAVF